MPVGKKTGGRTKGTPNKKTAEKLAALESSGLMPLDFMMQVLRDEKQPFDERKWAANSAAPYVHPKLANIEHAQKDGKPWTLQFGPLDGGLT